MIVSDSYTENEENCSTDSYFNSNEIILATGGYDNSILLWQAHTGSILNSLNHPSFQVNQLLIHPLNPLLFSATKGEVRRYNLVTTNKDPDLIFDTGKGRNITGIDICNDGSWMASCSDDGQVHIWCLKDTKSYQVMNRTDQKHKYNFVKVHPNQVHLILGRDKADIVLWDLRNDKTIVVAPKSESNDIFVGQNLHYTSFAVDPISSSIAITSLNTKSVFRLDLTLHDDSICGNWLPNFFSDPNPGGIHNLHCSFSADSTYYACTLSDGTAIVHNTADGTDLFRLYDDTCNDWIWDCAFTSDSRYLFTACSDGNTRLWSLETLTKVREYVGHRCCVTTLAFRD